MDTGFNNEIPEQKKSSSNPLAEDAHHPMSKEFNMPKYPPLSKSSLLPECSIEELTNGGCRAPNRGQSESPLAPGSPPPDSGGSLRQPGVNQDSSRISLPRAPELDRDRERAEISPLPNLPEITFDDHSMTLGTNPYQDRNWVVEGMTSGPKDPVSSPKYSQPTHTAEGRKDQAPQ